jgi:hypothetical protein
MSLVDAWMQVENALAPGWTDATVSLEIEDAQARTRAAALLGPAGPGFAGGTIRFTVSTRGHGVGPDGARRLLERIDGEKISGTLELVSSAVAPVAAPAPELASRTLSDSWNAALAELPSDWSDAVVELDLDSSADVDRGAVLCAPLNPVQTPHRPGLRFRSANQRGYGASAGMVGRCLGRLDDDGISGRVRITRVLSDVHPVGTQGAVFSPGRRPS